MTTPGRNAGPATTPVAAIGNGSGATWWLKVLAVAFLVLVAADTGYALRTGELPAMGGDASARDAFDQRQSLTVDASPSTPHLQVAMLQAADRDDRDFALLCAAQVPLTSGMPRNVRLRFRDERTMSKRELDERRQRDEHRRETGRSNEPTPTEDRVWVARTATLPPQFSKSQATLTLRFMPHGLDATGCKFEVDGGSVFIECIDQMEEEFDSFELDAAHARVMTVEDSRIVAVLRLAPEAVENEQLLAVAQWHDALDATPIPSASKQLPLEPQWWHGAVLLAGLLLVGVLAALAPVGTYAASASPSRGALLVMLFCLQLEFGGFAGALLAMLLTNEWVHRPRSRRGALPLLLFAVAITADIVWVARWWHAAPFVVAFDLFAVLGRRAALLLLGLWVLGDRERRGRAWFAVAVVADLVASTGYHAMAFGASRFAIGALHGYAQSIALLAALGYLVCGSRRPRPAPHDEPAGVAPASI